MSRPCVEDKGNESQPNTGRGKQESRYRGRREVIPRKRLRGNRNLRPHEGRSPYTFYVNFTSKKDLAVQACERAFSTAMLRWRTVTMFRNAIVTSAATDAPLATLSIDAARHDCSMRSVFDQGLQQYIEILTEAMPDGSPSAKRKRALSMLSEMVGAVILARVAVTHSLSDEILNATTISLAGRRPRSEKRSAR
jgi:TetR/AcrR family transcriptional regulator, transcriptional repressor for nem operon